MGRLAVDGEKPHPMTRDDPRSGDRAAADRLPARARPRGDLPGARRSGGRRPPCWPPSPTRSAERARAGHAARAARHRRQDRRGGRGGGGRARPRLPGPSSRRRGPAALAEGGAALRAALRGDLHTPLRLVRRRLAHRGDGGHRDRARPRVPRAHRPLAAAARWPTGCPRSGSPAAGGGRRRSTSTSAAAFRLLKGIEVDILEDGGLDQTDEMLGRLDVRGRLACTPSCGWTRPR